MKKGNDLDRTNDIIDLIKSQKSDYNDDFSDKKLNTLKFKKNQKGLRDLVEEKKEDELITQIKNTSIINKPSSKGFHLFLSFLFTIMIFLSFAYIGYTLFKFDESTEQTKMIINSCILFILSISLIFIYSSKKIKWKRFFTCIGTICISSFFVFNILVDFNLFHLPENKLIPDFQDISITKALKWAKENKIDVTQIYDNSDQIKEYNIIAQDIKPNTLLRNTKKIKFTVSEGPDFNKEISIANMVGWNIDDAMEEIEENYLNNVSVDFEMNDEVMPDVIISQSRDGQMKRNDELNLMVSLGDGSDLKPVPIIDFSKQTLLKASVWLKRHGISYDIEYEFSDTIPKGSVIRQSIKKGTTVTPKEDKIVLTVSKGKKIVVPDLTKMSTGEVTNWVISNKLKVRFEERYHATVKKGFIIEANYKENDVVEEGTLIEITSSKGKLTMKKFNSVNEFRTWANEHDIKIQEEYEQSKTVDKGSIIKFSIEEGTPVNTGDVITVYISTGSTIVIPNFVGKSKSYIESNCKDLGLNCTFSYGGKSSYNKDIAISQNKKPNSEVIPDTYVNIVLSEGKTESNTNKPNHSNTSNNSGESTVKPTPTPTPTPKPTPTPTPSCIRKENTLIIQDTWIGSNGNQTKDNLEKKLSTKYPNVKFNIVVSDLNGTSGFIHESSEVNTGSTIYDCESYTIYVVR